MVAVGTVAWGCGSGPDPSAQNLPTATASRDGILVSLTIDRPRPIAGAGAGALVTVANTSLKPRPWQGGGCNFVASITIDTAAEVAPPEGRAWPGLPGQFKGLLLQRPQPSRQGTFVDARFRDATRVGCPLDLGVNTLGPGELLEMRAFWNGEVNGVPAAPGPATIQASFPYLGAGPEVDPGDLSRRITAELRVVVDAAPGQLLSPGEAIDAALADPAFAAWVEAAGPMRVWDGVDMEAPQGAYVVILIVGGVSGRATVDRRTGAVSFEKKPRS